MKVHKLQQNDMTACGLHIWKYEIEASIDWKDVTCKKCKMLKKRTESPKH